MNASRIVPSPNELPVAAREQAWRLLWQRLLQEPPRTDDDRSDEQDDDAEDTA